MNDLALLAGRVLLSIIFILAGVSKIGNYAGTVGYMESFGVPGILLPVVIAVEVLGGLALLAGVMSRWAALALAGFTLIAAVIFHNNFGDQVQQIMFMKNLAIAGGLLMMWVAGPGRYALRG